MTNWTEAEILNFWEQNEEGYAGDTKAKIVIGLTKKYTTGRVLDVGAGSGALVKQLPDAVGIDISPKSNQVIRASIAKMPFENETFGTIFATDLLEHLSDETLVAGLREVWRTLKYGGHLIVVVPYNEKLKRSMVYCPHCGSLYHRWGHNRAFDENSLSSLLKGYELVKLQLLPIGLMGERRTWWHQFYLKHRTYPDKMDLLVVAKKV